MDDTTTPQPSARDDAGRARWITVLLVRVTILTAAAFILQLSGSAAWDAHVLAMRGEHRPATVLEVTRTTWFRPDRATVAVQGVDPPAAALVTTQRKDLDVGDRVDAIVDPREPQRAALAGDGWPWRQALLPLLALPLIALFGVRYGRWRTSEPAQSPAGVVHPSSPSARTGIDARPGAEHGLTAPGQD
jgi:hypothetical protein